MNAVPCPMLAVQALHPAGASCPGLHESRLQCRGSLQICAGQSMRFRLSMPLHIQEKVRLGKIDSARTASIRGRQVSISGREPVVAVCAPDFKRCSMCMDAEHVMQVTFAGQAHSVPPNATVSLTNIIQMLASSVPLSIGLLRPAATSLILQAKLISPDPSSRGMRCLHQRSQDLHVGLAFASTSVDMMHATLVLAGSQPQTSVPYYKYFSDGSCGK